LSSNGVGGCVRFPAFNADARAGGSHDAFEQGRRGGGASWGSWPFKMKEAKSLNRSCVAMPVQDGGKVRPELVGGDNDGR